MINRLYVHVPFCIEKCNYCAFVSKRPEKNELMEYPELLIRELETHQSEITIGPINSIYFGGGTPSLLQPPQIKTILDKIAAQSVILTEAEITLETNPGTVDIISLKAFRTAGINRLSLGVQSFDDDFLRCLGRIHSAEQSRQAFKDARTAGFNNISIDLMNSLPGQNLDQWKTELRYAIDLCPEHLSVYGLTVEEGTPFESIYPAGCPKLADEDLSADMFEVADELLTESGFEHYEIANYARPGHRSQHNNGYWKRDGYLGLGVAAHSFLRNGYGIRFSNSNDLNEYRQSVTSGQLVQIDNQQLTQNDAMAEYMFLGLRLAEGVNIHAFESEFGTSLESIYESETAKLIGLGLIIQNDNVIKLTQRGMLLSNQVFARFL